MIKEGISTLLRDSLDWIDCFKKDIVEWVDAIRAEYSGSLEMDPEYVLNYTLSAQHAAENLIRRLKIIDEETRKYCQDVPESAED